MDPDALTQTLGLFALLFTLAVAVRVWWDDRVADMHREFEERFPGECSVCSYHRYGVQHGHVRPGKPPPEHECARRGRAARGTD